MTEKKYVELKCKHCKAYTPTQCISLGMPMDINTLITCKDYQIESLTYWYNKFKALLPEEVVADLFKESEDEE